MFVGQGKFKAYTRKNNVHIFVMSCSSISRQWYDQPNAFVHANFVHVKECIT